jgi:uncharacterized membrane protein
MLYYCRFSDWNIDDINSAKVKPLVMVDRLLSRKKLTIIAIASIIGLIVSGYLSFVKLFHTPIYCTPGLGDCQSVNSSQWSEIWGIPVAILGLAGYLAILLIVFFGSKISLVKSYTSELLFGIALFGFLFSAYLTYLELFVLKTICQWCVLSALCMTVIFFTSIFLIKRDRTNSLQIGGK